MKVLLVNSLFGRRVSGSGQHVYTIWKHLRDRVEFIVWSVENIGYIDVPKLRSASFYLRARLKSIPEAVDIIHIHNPKFAGLFRGGKNNILTIHGDYKGELGIQYGALAKPLVWYIDRQVGKADVVTSVSPLWAKLRGWRWIPNMVEIEEIWRVLREREVSLPFREGSYILFVGRDDPVKDYPLFRAVAEKAYKELRLRAVALGAVRGDTEYLRHGRVPWEDVLLHMRCALALVITSRQEGLPTVLLEAWATGCPVVARDIPPLRALARMYPGSMLLFDGEDEAIVALSTLLHREDVRRGLVRRGLEVVRRFDAPAVAEEYYRLYREVLDRDTRRG